jgi:serine/threonine-protein kinase
LLYELIAGTRPRRDASQDDLLRAAQDGTPVPPITDALAAPDRLSERAGALHLSPAKLQSMLHGDLGTIVQTATQVDPTLRYDRADDLAGDLRRFFDQRPITARPPTLRYRTRKFIARNPSLVASTSLAVLALVAGLLLSLWQAGIAADERDRAQHEAAKSEQMAGFMRDLFRSNDPDVALGDSLTVGEILDRGRTRVLTELDGQPEVQRAMAAEIASIYISMGKGTEAESLLTTTRDRAGSPLPRTPEMASILYLLGTVRDLAGDVEDAIAYHQRALDMRLAMHGRVDYTVGESLNQLANVHTYSGHYALADSLYQRALSVLAATADTTDDAYTSTVHNYAWMTRRHGDLARADSLYLRAYVLARANLPKRHPEILTTLNGLALVRKTRGNHASADTLYRTILREQIDILGPEHPSTGITHSNLGMLLKATGRPDEAAEHVRSALSIWETALGERHPYVAVGASNLGMIEADRGNLPDAERHLRRALSIHRDVLPDDHPRLASTLVGLGRVLISAGDLGAAQSLIEEGHAIRRRIHRADHPSIGESYLALATLAEARGNQPAATRHLSTAWDAVCARGTRSSPPPICQTIADNL